MALKFLSPIHKATRQIQIHLKDGLGDSGVSATEGHLIVYVRSYGPCSINELHRVFGHQRSTLTSILDRLEGRGILERTINSHDRRSFMIELSRSGKRLAGCIQRQLTDLEAKISERITDDDLLGFQRIMSAISEITRIDVRGRER